MFPTYYDRSAARSAQSATRFASEEVIHANKRTSRDFSSVDDRLDRLVLLCEAMWELLQEHTDLEDQDLRKRFSEIDQRDGSRNFRRQRVAHPCECGAKIPPVRTTCQFCGAPSMPGTLFDLI